MRHGGKDGPPVTVPIQQKTPGFHRGFYLERAKRLELSTYSMISCIGFLNIVYYCAYFTSVSPRILDLVSTQFPQPRSQHAPPSQIHDPEP